MKEKLLLYMSKKHYHITRNGAIRKYSSNYQIFNYNLK